MAPDPYTYSMSTELLLHVPSFAELQMKHACHLCSLMKGDCSLLTSCSHMHCSPKAVFDLTGKTDLSWSVYENVRLILNSQKHRSNLDYLYMHLSWTLCTLCITTTHVVLTLSHLASLWVILLSSPYIPLFMVGKAEGKHGNQRNHVRTKKSWPNFFSLYNLCPDNKARSIKILKS